MKLKHQISVIVIILLTVSKSAYSQACCTAGTPLLGSLEMTSAPKGRLQFGVTYEHNSLTNVLTGSVELDNPERERISESALVEVNYGVSNKLSLTALFSYINQVRTITNYGTSENTLIASGIGDIALITKYSLIEFDIFDTQQLAVGIGLKIPTGNSSLKSNGILIPADMQPGSGSWDGIFWGFYSKGEVLTPDLTFLGNISFRLNGTNDRFENSQKGYGFGNEFITSAGLNYAFSSFIDLTFLIKYRNTKPDSFNSQGIPNTGGNWLYAFPGINFYINDRLSTRVDGELPVYQNVLGTQLTTTFTASISFFYSININEGIF